ncbi:MAG TPA: hypothetical protein VGC40_00820 [Paenirhodobacter sp.]
MGNTDLLKQLARAKAAFQLRAIEAVICAQPHQSKHDQEQAPEHAAAQQGEG